MAANIQNQAAPPQLSEEDKKKQTWGEYGRQVYNEQYERWVPWLEDWYLKLFTKDNKASYATKGLFKSPHPHPNCHLHLLHLPKPLIAPPSLAATPLTPL